MSIKIYFLHVLLEPTYKIVFTIKERLILELYALNLSTNCPDHYSYF